jgi:GNAT acetyltransferase-like protein
MLALVPAEGAFLERVLDTRYSVEPEGLSRQAFTTLDIVQRRTAWALRCHSRVALVDGSELLASAERYGLAGVLGHQHVRICGIAAVCTDPECGNSHHARELVERLTDEARRNGADVAILFVTTDRIACVPDGFAAIPTADIELSVEESPRHGAPMTLMRGAEDRDLPAIVAMGQVRAGRYRFHLDRDVDLVKYVITKKRLQAGLAAAGARQLQFMIAEEGITAAAYVVVSIADGTWTIEECGDRDVSGARVGALLQALIAREPAERRPLIRGWLPAGFVPPQVTILSKRPSTELIFGQVLATRTPLRLSAADILFWRSDVF